MITGFILAHLGLLMILVGFIIPRYYDVFIPVHRRDEGAEQTVACEPREEVAAKVVDGGSGGAAALDRSSHEGRGSKRLSEDSHHVFLK